MGPSELEVELTQLVNTARAAHGEPPMERPISLETGDGWNDLIENAITRLVINGWHGQVLQIKEKFGTLRLYVDDLSADYRRIIDEAEEASGRTCEGCGQPGTKRGDGWIKVRCDACQDLHLQIKRVNYKRFYGLPTWEFPGEVYVAHRWGNTGDKLWCEYQRPPEEPVEGETHEEQRARILALPKTQKYELTIAELLPLIEAYDAARNKQDEHKDLHSTPVPSQELAEHGQQDP